MSVRSGGGQEAILPAVLEFPEGGQAQFLAAAVSRLDPSAPAFKLAPVYTLYLCARYYYLAYDSQIVYRLFMT